MYLTSLVNNPNRCRTSNSIKKTTRSCTIEFQNRRSLPTNPTAKGIPEQVGDSASSSARSMDTFAFSTTTPPRGATFIFGSWVCVANGSGSFDSHLTNSPTLKNPMSEDSNKFARSHDRGVTLLPDLAKETEPKLEDNSSSTRTQIDLKPKSTRIGTLLAQPVFGLRNSSSAYKQMI